MQRYLCFFLIWTFGGFVGLHAQPAHLTVYISDAETGERLPAATIIVGAEGKVADVSGQASWELDPGEYAVVCSYIGYQTLRDTFFCMAGERTEKYYALLPTQLLLEAATVTSSRSTRSLAEATVSLDIIKPDFIKRNNAVSLDAVLDRIPGVQILDGQPNIRGGSGYSYGAGSRVMLLLNDVPILQADAGFPNWRDLPIENAGQIEVLKGAASTLYGSAALNGIINMKTDYARSEPETEALLFTTVQDRPADREKAWWDKGKSPVSYGGHFIHRRKWQKWDLSAGAYHINRESHYRNAGNIFSRAYAHTRYRINDRLVASLGTILNTGESQSYFYWRSAGALEGAPPAYSSGSFTRLYIDPRLNYFDKTGAQHRFLGRVMAVNNENNNDQGNTSRWYYGEYQYQKEFDDNRWSLSAGLVGITSWTDSPLFSDTRINQSNLAAYVQAEAKPIEGLSLSGGARYEYNRIATPDSIAGEFIDQSKLKEGKPIFRLGANYKTGKATYWRASWGEGYRFPTIAEKFISTNAGVLLVTPNPSLESETGWTAEVGVKQGVLFGGLQGFFDMSLFWSQYNNMMEFTLVFDGQNFSFQSQNVGETRIRGGEISFTGQGNIGPFSGQMLVGYTYLDPQFLDFDLSGRNIPINERANATEGQINAANTSVDYNILKYRSVHQFKSDISLGWEGVTIGWAIRQASHVEAVDRIFEDALPGVKQYRELNNQGYWVHDFRVGYKFYAHQLTFLAQNANNEDYAVRPGILEAPRSYTLQYLIRI
jgi:outer membrane receptor protein involved in Fe transport